MRTIETQLFKFSELSDDAKKLAIEQYREREYFDDWGIRWVIDDCYLFEPKYEELHKLFGKEYDDRQKPIIGNTRKVYFDTDRNSHLDADEGIIINDERMFLIWLGIPESMHEFVYFTIRDKGGRYTDTIIEFEPNDWEHEFSDEENKILEDAADKFSDHMDNVLNNIKKSLEDYYSDENLMEQLDVNEYEYHEDGTRY